MNIIQAKDYKELSQKAAALIAGRILAKPHSVLGFATGGTPVGTYEALVEYYKQGILSFASLTSFNLDEYIGVPQTDPNSYYAFMHQNLFDHVDMRPDSIHLPSGTAADPNAECDAYEAAIKSAGGIDLQLLGIGNNGHIAFNEPDDHFSAKTQVVKLTESTIDANSRFYKSRDEVPTTAITTGIGTIMAARSILLLASGLGKKDIIKKSLYGPVTPEVPASILQFHPDLTVICDFPV